MQPKNVYHDLKSSSFIVLSDGAQLVRSRFHAGKERKKKNCCPLLLFTPCRRSAKCFSTVKETVTDDKEGILKTLSSFKKKKKERKWTYMQRRL